MNAYLDKKVNSRIILFTDFLILASSSTRNKPSVLSSGDLEMLVTTTKQTKEQIQRLFDLFKDQFPQGTIFKKYFFFVSFFSKKFQFFREFSRFYPSGTSTSRYCDHIFR